MCFNGIRLYACLYACILYIAPDAVHAKFLGVCGPHRRVKARLRRPRLHVQQQLAQVVGDAYRFLYLRRREHGHEVAGVTFRGA